MKKRSSPKVSLLLIVVAIIDLAYFGQWCARAIYHMQAWPKTTGYVVETTARNWGVIGLSPRNCVVYETTDGVTKVGYPDYFGHIFFPHHKSQKVGIYYSESSPHILLNDKVATFTVPVVFLCLGFALSFWIIGRELGFIRLRGGVQRGSRRAQEDIRTAH